MPAEIVGSLAAHLSDEREFWLRFPVPTVAANDPTFDAETMWRGPTWINVNYLLIEGLQRSGLADMARELRQRTLELVSRSPDLYEYYHPLTGERPPKAASTFGWTAALFIDLAIQASRESLRGD
jgi:glycogen debranching enzyme